MRPALADRHDPHLRESRAVRVPGRLAGVAELRGVLRRVRSVPLEPVDRHQPPPAQERAPGQQVRGRLRDLPEQLLQRLVPEPLPGLGDPARGRHAPRGIPALPRGQGPGQPRRDLLVVLVGEQGHRHREVDHHVRRQLAVPPPRLPPGSRDRVVHRVPGNRGSQHPQGDLVRQPAALHHAIVAHAT